MDLGGEGGFIGMVTYIVLLLWMLRPIFWGGDVVSLYVIDSCEEMSHVSEEEEEEEELINEKKGQTYPCHINLKHMREQCLRDMKT